MHYPPCIACGRPYTADVVITTNKEGMATLESWAPESATSTMVSRQVVEELISDSNLLIEIETVIRQYREFMLAYSGTSPAPDANSVVGVAVKALDNCLVLLSREVEDKDE